MLFPKPWIWNQRRNSIDFNSNLERLENVKDKRIPDIVIYQVDSIKQHYDENMELLTKQFPIADQLVMEGKESAAKTIWRTQVVLLASAFDYFMHEIVWYGLDKIYDGVWEQPPQYKNLTTTFETLQKIKEYPDNKDWYVDYITEKYKKQTLMEFGDVRDHLNLIGVDPNAVADTAFYQRGSTDKTLNQMKTKLNTLYWRRNHIAHQSDRSERNAEKKDITKQQVEEFIENIDKIVAAITEEVKKM